MHRKVSRRTAVKRLSRFKSQALLILELEAQVEVKG